MKPYLHSGDLGIRKGAESIRHRSDCQTLELSLGTHSFRLLKGKNDPTSAAQLNLHPLIVCLFGHCLVVFSVAAATLNCP